MFALVEDAYLNRMRILTDFNELLLPRKSKLLREPRCPVAVEAVATNDALAALNVSALHLQT